MRNAKEIFIKQAKDMFKNIGVLVQFIIFPVVALIMTRLVAMPNYDIPNDMFVTMMAAIFAGMGLVSSTAGVIAEDIENKSLRLLVMAGVKPQQYLLGVGGFILLAAAVTSVAFGVIGGFASAEMLKFLAIMVTGAAASIILGATIGIFAKNQQAATGIALPIAMILGFTPMIANFNETVDRVAVVFHTQQLNTIVNDFDANFTKAIGIVCANIAILTILFAIAYKKKGLKG